MVRITNDIDIDAPAHDVYVAVRALDDYPSWLGYSLVYRGTKLKAADSERSLAYEDSTTVGRMSGELVEDVPDHTLRFHQSKPSGGLDALIRYEITDAGTSTHLTRVGDMTTHGMLHAMQPILVRMASAESKRTMKALKTHVEQHG